MLRHRTSYLVFARCFRIYLRCWNCCGARMTDYRFGDLIFDRSLISARDNSGEELTFTRAERALLSALIAHPRRVLSRNALLDAMSGTGSDASDRNVDFVINRLRAKLGDPARSPRFIATRYGEGYVWVAEPTQPADALLVIGPVHMRSTPAGGCLRSEDVRPTLL